MIDKTSSLSYLALSTAEMRISLATTAQVRQTVSVPSRR